MSHCVTKYVCNIMRDLSKYSNPKVVYKKARQVFGKDVELYQSNNQTKKYAIVDPNTHKIVNFGQMGYEDYTKHNDAVRRERFLKRNHKWKNAYQYSPAYLSYHLLW